MYPIGCKVKLQRVSGNQLVTYCNAVIKGPPWLLRGVGIVIMLSGYPGAYPVSDLKLA